jgi:hypothetical protein
MTLTPVHVLDSEAPAGARVVEADGTPASGRNPSDGGSTGFQSLPVNVWETDDAYLATLMAAPGDISMGGLAAGSTVIVDVTYRNRQTNTRDNLVFPFSLGSLALRDAPMHRGGCRRGELPPKLRLDNSESALPWRRSETLGYRRARSPT